jgi:hypothetical protein
MGMAHALEDASNFAKIPPPGSDALLTVIRASQSAERAFGGTKHRFRVALVVR